MRHKFRLLSAFTVASACSGQLSATNRVLGLGFVIPHILLHIVVCEKKNLNTYHLIIWQQGWLLYRPSGCPWVSSKQCLPVSLWGCGSSFSSHCNFPFPISLFAFCIFLSHFPPGLHIPWPWVLSNFTLISFQCVCMPINIIKRILYMVYGR